jgi:hypothetical protein
LHLEFKPFPVTVIGVTVVEARGTKTGVPAAATCAAENPNARTLDAIFRLIVNKERKERCQLSTIGVWKTRVRSEAFQVQPREERKVGS